MSDVETILNIGLDKAEGVLLDQLGELVGINRPRASGEVDVGYRERIRKWIRENRPIIDLAPESFPNNPELGYEHHDKDSDYIYTAHKDEWQAPGTQHAPVYTIRRHGSIEPVTPRFQQVAEEL